MFNPKNLLALLPPAQRPLRLALRLTPEPLLAPLIASLATHLLRGQPVQERLAEMAGKRVSLLIADPACELRFRITGRVFDRRATSLNPARRNVPGRPVHTKAPGSLPCCGSTG